jgi:hypothetical protein
MASGYGNRSKWTVNELLTRNEQARALGQKGLSNSQIGSAMEGAIGADLQAAGVHEQNLMVNRRENQRLGLEQDRMKNQEKANTMGGYVDMAKTVYGQYKKGNLNTQALAKDTSFQQNIVRPIQLRSNLNAVNGYGLEGGDYQGGIGSEAIPKPLGTPDVLGGGVETDLAIGQLNTSGYAGGGGAISDSTQVPQALGVGGETIQGAETVADVTKVASTTAEVTSLAADALKSTSNFAGPIGAMAGAAMSAGQGNYAKAAVDLAIYGIGMCFGPIGMMVSLMVNLLPDSIMNPVYELFA